MRCSSFLILCAFASLREISPLPWGEDTKPWPKGPGVVGEGFRPIDSAQPLTAATRRQAAKSRCLSHGERGTRGLEAYHSVTLNLFQGLSFQRHRTKTLKRVQGDGMWSDGLRKPKETIGLRCATH